MDHGKTRKVGLGAALVSAVLLGVGFIGCSKANDPWKGLGGPPRVLVSFAPLYSYAKNVAGDDAAVLSLMTSQGPHEHELVSEDALKFRKADLFFMIGLSLEKKDLVERLKKNSGNHEAEIIELGEMKNLKLLEHEDHDEDEDDHDKKPGHDKEHGHEHGKHDPHVWLGVPEAIVMVQKMRDELSAKDPSHKKGYEERAADYIKTLKNDVLDYGRKALAKKKNRKLIAMHDSLGYFARTFHLTVVDSIQPRPGEEADAQKIKKLVEECQKHNVRVIAVEPQYSQGHADTLVGELKKRGVTVKIVTIDPLETVTGELTADFYVRKMRENLDNLSKALP
jgi:zinc transport system substrate-binding protein